MPWTAEIIADAAAAATRWDALPEGAAASPYATRAFLEGMAAVTGTALAYAFAGDGAGDVVGLGLLSRRRLGLRQGVRPPFMAYAALRAAALPTPADVNHARSWWAALLPLLEDHFDHLDVTLPPEVADVRAAQWRGWTARPLYTARLALHPDADPLATWSSRARTAFRQERRAFRVEEAREVAACVALCEASYARHGRTLPLPAPVLLRLAEGLVEAGEAHCLVARQGEQPEAGLIVLRHGPQAHYWVAGSRPGPAMRVLLGEALPRLAAAGVSCFDYVGANTASIAEFKRQLGGSLTPYHALVWTRPAWLRAWLAWRGRP